MWPALKKGGRWITVSKVKGGVIFPKENQHAVTKVRDR